MLKINNISYNTIDEQNIFSEINFVVNDSDKIGLVGTNGSGKTTLLKIISNTLSPTKGKILNTKSLNIAYFPQTISSQDLVLNIENYFLKNNRDLKNFEIKKALNLTGLDSLPLDRRVSSLSGGQKNKLLLSVVMSSSADLILLDEPTNNMDIEGLNILEDYIKGSRKMFIIVSHDRRFLQKTTNKIILLTKNESGVKIYSLGYEEFMEARVQEKELIKKKYEEHLLESKRLGASYNKQKNDAVAASKSRKLKDNDKGAFKARKQRASNRLMSSAKSLETRISKMEAPERPKKVLDMNHMFAVSQDQLGAVVATFENAFLGYENTKYEIGPINLNINKGDRIVILGPNGIGKSTLLKALLEKTIIKKGILKIGPSVVFGPLDQEQSLPLPEGNALENFKKLISLENDNSKVEGKARELMARYGIKENALNPVDTLSPGERSRLLLASLAFKGCNVLLFDEPTNHLDISASEELENALRDYKGTYIIVSHDREFIENIQPNKIYEFTEKGISLKI